MRPTPWPDWLDDVWAKSAEKGAGGQPESLARHTWEVLQRLADLIHLRPTLPDAVGVPRLWHVLFWGAFLHDFGKAATGFQARLRNGPQWPYRHEVLSLAFLDWVTEDMDPNEQAWVAAAIVSHHKDAADIQRLYAEPDDPEEDELAAQIAELSPATVRGLWRWVNDCAKTWIDDLGLMDAGITVPSLPTSQAALDAVTRRGVQRVYAWLAVYRRFVRLANDGPQSLIIVALTLRGHIINADHSASAHAGSLPQVVFDADAILASRGLTPGDLYGYQKTAMITDGSVLVVAPTGTGKTETSLLWAARQAQHGATIPRLFYTLPYQASMNAMSLRLQKAFGESNVGLQHGRGLLAMYRMLLDRDDYDPAKAARAARWARDLARLNYPPVRVFSPYQMLKAMYRLKGYEAQLSDYHSALFIFDEIHAYETRRLAKILTTIEWLAQNFGARFLVMSATFPSLIRQRLRETLNYPTEITAEASLYSQFRRHRLHLLPGEILSDRGVERIVQDAREGKSVLAVCNVVARAQMLFHRLSKQLEGDRVPVVLLHGRFNLRDRSRKERLIRDAIGANSDQRRPIVLVATQVVEVSLDIDLDTIYTDPAPLEALIQRFGRVNRRGKQVELAPVYVYQEPADGQKIYDGELIRGALQILERENSQPLDESAVGGWLDEIYSGEIAERWQLEYQEAAAEFRRACVRTMVPFAAAADLEKAFYQAFDSVEVLPESLYDEYEEALEAEPIRAGELLVPITWGRYQAMASRNQVLPHDDEHPPIARTPYDSDIGLLFDKQTETQDDL